MKEKKVLENNEKLIIQKPIFLKSLFLLAPDEAVAIKSKLTSFQS
jgi:hypothetical protein